jgi:hypothetical protein
MITGIPDGSDTPVTGGAGAEMREISKQLDELLAELGLNSNSEQRVRFRSEAADLLGADPKNQPIPSTAAAIT